MCDECESHHEVMQWIVDECEYGHHSHSDYDIAGRHVSQETVTITIITIEPLL